MIFITGLTQNIIHYLLLDHPNGQHDESTRQKVITSYFPKNDKKFNPLFANLPSPSIKAIGSYNYYQPIDLMSECMHSYTFVAIYLPYNYYILYYYTPENCEYNTRISLIIITKYFVFIFNFL